MCVTCGCGAWTCFVLKLWRGWDCSLCSLHRLRRGGRMGINAVLSQLPGVARCEGSEGGQGLAWGLRWDIIILVRGQEPALDQALGARAVLLSLELNC